ncbi:MAG: multicopper oxidase [Bacteroidetes bacterium]|nr:multicopper oxidase [Bacteroidota bacterium]
MIVCNLLFRYRTSFILIGFLWLCNESFATTIHQALYINRGTFVTVKSTTFPFLAFNETNTFNALNKVVLASIGDSLQITLTNNDTLIHGFSIQQSGVQLTVGVGQTTNILYVANAAGNFIYYDHLNAPDNRYLGLAGMICVSSSTVQKYFWNLKEHQSDFNLSLSQGITVNWNTYYPDYFTINGKSFPDLQNDSTAKVTAHVGDTLLIFVANTGQSMHSLHFHGFHALCIFSSDANKKLNWEKDTWPLKSMESIVLELIPDKTGKYSVHDHNLVAVTAGNTHPNGMFTIMEIQ